ncbi:MAG: sterol desaturase family protein [Paludibacter sp.]|nr:sterol desaturase family protein [Paludibacter sp.]
MLETLENNITETVLNPFFHWFVGLSIFFWGLEIFFPWRKNQSIFRKDFWLDGFYMFFNLFIFPVLLLNFLASLTHQYLWVGLNTMGIQQLNLLNISSLPSWVQILVFFLLRDFVQFNIHRLLHRVDWLWQFHKVHHSVKEMGFAAHLRYHWVEGLVYSVLQYVPLALLGMSAQDFTIMYIITIAIGHFNHSNFSIQLGWFKYIVNNPQMHIWHHAKKLPESRRYGVNFGLSLSVWDYLFKTNYIPGSGRDIELGFGDEKIFPKMFWGQFIYPLQIK